MRRMIPQKLIDFIKAIKDKITPTSDGLEIEANSIKLSQDVSPIVNHTGPGLYNDDGEITFDVGYGLEINDDNTVSVKPKTNGGIEVSSDGVSIKTWTKTRYNSNNATLSYSASDQSTDFILPNHSLHAMDRLVVMNLTKGYVIYIDAYEDILEIKNDASNNITYYFIDSSETRFTFAGDVTNDDIHIDVYTNDMNKANVNAEM